MNNEVMEDAYNIIFIVRKKQNQPKLKCLADVPKIFHLWTEPLTIFKKPIINKS